MIISISLNCPLRMLGIRFSLPRFQFLPHAPYIISYSGLNFAILPFCYVAISSMLFGLWAGFAPAFSHLRSRTCVLYRVNRIMSSYFLVPNSPYCFLRSSPVFELDMSIQTVNPPFLVFHLFQLDAMQIAFCNYSVFCQLPHT